MSFDLLVVGGDLVLSGGDLGTVQGTNKLAQDITKICLTTAGANIKQPWYGSFMSRVLIGNALDANITTTMAQSQLQNALETLKKLQQLQVTESQQQVTPDEQLAGIKDISIMRGPDPRAFSVSVDVLNRAFKHLTVELPVVNR